MGWYESKILWAILFFSKTNFIRELHHITNLEFYFSAFHSKLFSYTINKQLIIFRSERCLYMLLLQLYSLHQMSCRHLLWLGHYTSLSIPDVNNWEINRIMLHAFLLFSVQVQILHLIGRIATITHRVLLASLFVKWSHTWPWWHLFNIHCSLQHRYTWTQSVGITMAYKYFSFMPQPRVTLQPITSRMIRSWSCDSLPGTKSSDTGWVVSKHFGRCHWRTEVQYPALHEGQQTHKLKETVMLSNADSLFCEFDCCLVFRLSSHRSFDLIWSHSSSSASVKRCVS